MKKISKLGYMALFLSGVLSLSACATEDEEVKGVSKTLDKDHVFSQKDMSDLLDNIEITEISDIYVSDGYLYMRGDYNGDEYVAYNRFGSIKLDGTDAKIFQPNEEDIYYFDDEDYEDGEFPAELFDEEEGLAADGLERPHRGEEDTGNVAKDEASALSENQDAVEDQAVLEDDGAAEDEEMSDAIEEYDYEYEDYEDGYEYSYTNYRDMVVYEGNFIVLKEEYTETYVDDEFQSIELYSFVSYDRDGNVLNEYQLPESDEDYLSIEYFQITKDGHIFYVQNEDEIVHLDASFQVVDSQKVDGLAYIYNLYVIGDSLIYRGWDEEYENQKVYRINTKTNQTEEFEIPAVALSGIIYPGNEGVDMYIVTEKEIYSWNVDSGEVVEVLDFIDSDVDISYVEGFCAMSEDDFIIMYSDSVNYETCVAEFVKVEPEKVADKKVITLSCEYLDYNIKSQVISFNKENDTYRIQVIDYSIYDTYDDYNAGLTRLNNDIASGNIPDIMLLNSGMPLTSYNEKGLFADLKEFVEKDSNYSMDQFASNIVNSYSYNGKWYALVPSYSVRTFGAKKSLVGDKENWTVEDALALWEQYPDSVLIEDATKDSILYEGLYCMGNQFVDWKTGSCKFNTDEFVSLLEFANKFQEETEYSDEYWDEYYSTYETMYRDNKTLCMFLYISSISGMNYHEYGRMGEEIAFVGFPTESGNGGYISPELMFAITSKSKEKEGAWEFLSYYLSDEYESDGLSIRMDKLQEEAIKATQRPYYTDEDGEKVEYDDYYYIGDKEILIEPMSEERANAILEYVLSIETTSFYDEDLTTLISEEADSFFSGQKSAKEVADIIQSRAQIYVNEHM